LKIESGSPGEAGRIALPAGSLPFLKFGEDRGFEEIEQPERAHGRLLRGPRGAARAQPRQKRAFVAHSTKRMRRLCGQRELPEDVGQTSRYFGKFVGAAFNR